MQSASGVQYEIVSGPYRAVITEVGATLRVLEAAGEPLITSFDVTEPSPGCRGQQLLPWPNRIRDGRWLDGDTERQLALTEPERHNAIHGLASWLPWSLVGHTPDEVVLEVVLHPQPGWPGTLRARIGHRLDASGLTVTVEATNLSDRPLPFGYAAHPYLTAGVSNPESVLSLPAGRQLLVDERLLPIELVDVAGETDLRRPTPLGERSLDTAFTALALEGGEWRATLAGPERRTVLWAEEAFGWAQVFSGTPEGVAVEPMTCGPDAFNPGPTDGGVITLDPGGVFTGRWGLASESIAKL